MTPQGASRPGWSEGARLLRERVDSIPGLLRAWAEREPPSLAFDPRELRRWFVTGIGSSAAHARFLAHLLADQVGLPARFASTGSLARGAPPGAEADGLIVFSQGLSPNARFALANPGNWRRVVLVTAVRPDAGDSGSAAGFAALCQQRGVAIVPLDAAARDETQTLVRVIGPMLGYAGAISLARAFSHDASTGECIPEVGISLLCERMEAASASIASVFPREAGLASLFGRETVLLAGSGYGELVQNLRGKILEGMGLPQPPLWDLLEFAHGGYQRIQRRKTTLIALAGVQWEDSPEATLWQGLRELLEPARHDLRVLRAGLPSPWCVFEHEAAFNELVLRWIDEHERDPRRWPGQGRDGALYQLAPPESPARVAADSSPVASARVTPTRVDPSEQSERALEGLSWPEVEHALEVGQRTAVIPLGSTEQHGPHLPFATDTWIADALAERFCQRVPEALRVPALSLGCASEHLDFPGTLSLSGENLERILTDLLVALAGHGFERAFVFSGHGGNLSALRSMEDRLRRAARPLGVIVFSELDHLVARWHAASARFGVSPEESGHHAGEFETSIVAALRPWAVRWSRLADGLAETLEALEPLKPVKPVGTVDPQRLFYPSLRENAPNGVVGDPRSAEASRGRHYLEIWTQALVEHYRVEARAR